MTDVGFLDTCGRRRLRTDCRRESVIAARRFAAGGSSADDRFLTCVFDLPRDASGWETVGRSRHGLGREAQRRKRNVRGEDRRGGRARASVDIWSLAAMTRRLTRSGFATFAAAWVR